MNKINKLYESEEKRDLFTKKKGNKLLNVVKAVTNCLMTQEICHNLELKRGYTRKEVNDLQEFLHVSHKQEKMQSFN